MKYLLLAAQAPASAKQATHALLMPLVEDYTKPLFQLMVHRWKAARLGSKEDVAGMTMVIPWDEFYVLGEGDLELYDARPSLQHLLRTGDPFTILDLGSVPPEPNEASEYTITVEPDRWIFQYRANGWSLDRYTATLKVADLAEALSNVDSDQPLDVVRITRSDSTSTLVLPLSESQLGELVYNDLLCEQDLKVTEKEEKDQVELTYTFKLGTMPANELSKLAEFDGWQ